VQTVVAAPPVIRATPPLRQQPAVTLATNVPAPNLTTVLVGLALETLSVQLTPALRVGQVRARLASRTVSLNVPPETLHSAITLKTGFDVENFTINQAGQIATIRLLPNRRPLELLEINRRFTVDDLEIESGSTVELTPNASASMSLQMLAAFRLQAVELSASFEVARLILASLSPRVRVSLDPAAAASGAIFQTSTVQLDKANQLTEIVLAPL
jgi:hypothetical protein